MKRIVAALIICLALGLLRAPSPLTHSRGGMGAIHAAKHTGTIVIVMTPVDDPVQAEVVTSLTRPGGNTTRPSLWGPEFNRPRLELLKEAIQRVRSTCYVFACCFRGCTNLPAVSEAFIIVQGAPARAYWRSDQWLRRRV
jgi:hypothetical protein